MENNYYQGYTQVDEQSYAVSANKLIKNVYLWMTFALVITGLTAFYVATTPQVLGFIFGTKAMFFILMIAELALVIGLTAAINRISALTATLMFMLYSVVNGATMATIFLAYTATSIATTFFVTAGMFGVMAVFGSVTNKDLTKIGNLCIMALLGLIIAIVLQLFYNYILSLIEGLTNEMEDSSISLLDLVVEYAANEKK